MGKLGVLSGCAESKEQHSRNIFSERFYLLSGVRHATTRGVRLSF